MKSARELAQIALSVNRDGNALATLERMFEELEEHAKDQGHPCGESGGDEAIAMIDNLIMAVQGFGLRNTLDCAEAIYLRLTGKPMTEQQRRDFL